MSHLHGSEYVVIPDQIEAGTFMFAAAVTKGDVTVKNIIPKHLESITAKLLEIGCEVEEIEDCIRVVASKPLRHTQVKTLCQIHHMRLTGGILYNRYSFRHGSGHHDINRRPHAGNVHIDTQGTVECGQYQQPGD